MMTFGPTRDTLAAYAAENAGDPASWIAAQMALPYTSHRARFRRKANPRMPNGDATFTLEAGGARGACGAHSRWHRFAFTVDDVGKTITAEEVAAGTLRLSVEGVARTDVPAAAFANATDEVAPWVVCAVKGIDLAGTDGALAGLGDAEAVGGSVRLGTDCAGEFANPAVAFAGDVPPDAARVVVTAPAGSFAQLRNPTYHSDVGGYDAARSPQTVLILNDASVDPQPCLDGPSFGPLFAKVTAEAGAVHFYRFDPRLELLANTLDEPTAAALSTIGGACPNVPHTFLNGAHCMAESPTCAALRYATVLLLLLSPPLSCRRAATTPTGSPSSFSTDTPRPHSRLTRRPSRCFMSSMGST